MSRALFAAVLVLGLSAGPVRARGASGDPGGDALTALRDDPSASAGDRLAELYKKTPGRDQRFWLIQALGVRLEARGDRTSLTTLWEAAGDPDPALRGPALRALSGFRGLSDAELRGGWLAKLDAAARKGLKDPAPIVRNGAEELRRSIAGWRGAASGVPGSQPGSAAGSAGPAPSSGWAPSRRWLMLLAIPLPLLLWTLLGLPVFAESRASGRAARAAGDILIAQPLLLCASVTLWLLLAMALAGSGFDLLVWLRRFPPELGPSLGLLVGYLAVGACLFGPAALLAGTLSRPEGRFPGLARFLSQAGVLTLFLFGAALPLELLYRLFLRRAGGPPREGALVWILETGALRAGMLVCAVLGREGHGLIPAVLRARGLFPAQDRARGLGSGCLDLRFVLLGAAPVFFLMCAATLRRIPGGWELPWVVVLPVCGLWALGILGGILLSFVLALDAMLCAARCGAAAGGELPGALAGLAPFLGDEISAEGR